MPKSLEGHGQHIPGALQCCLQYGVEGSGWLETQAELVVLLQSLGSLMASETGTRVSGWDYSLPLKQLNLSIP